MSEHSQGDRGDTETRGLQRTNQRRQEKKSGMMTGQLPAWLCENAACIIHGRLGSFSDIARGKREDSFFSWHFCRKHVIGIRSAWSNLLFTCLYTVQSIQHFRSMVCVEEMKNECKTGWFAEL